MFFSKDDKRIWRYTWPRYKGILRLVLSPPSLTKRWLDAFTQMERETRDYRGVQAKIREADHSDSEWEPRDTISRTFHGQGYPEQFYNNKFSHSSGATAPEQHANEQKVTADDFSTTERPSTVEAERPRILQ